MLTYPPIPYDLCHLCQFYVYLPWVNAHLGAINQEKVLVGETVIVKTDGSFADLLFNG